MNQPSPLALDIARHLCNQWIIGDGWETFGSKDVAVAIDTILLPRLAAHADAVEDALNSSVDSCPYPDGPNLDRDTRAALCKSLDDLKP